MISLSNTTLGHHYQVFAPAQSFFEVLRHVTIVIANETYASKIKQSLDNEPSLRRGWRVFVPEFLVFPLSRRS